MDEREPERVISDATFCPQCGKRTLVSTVRTDDCMNPNCDYGFYYPSAY